MNGVELKTLAEMKTSLIKFRLSKAQERWLIARLEVEAEENKQLREQIPDVVVTWGSGETAGINDAVRLRESVERDFALYRATVSVQLESAERRAQELEALFALQQTRMAGAVHLWQEANSKPGILPDLGDLLSWLLSRLSDMEQRALEAERRARELETSTYCAYCGEKFLLDDSAATKVTEHIYSCEKHPMREIERRAQEAEANWDANALKGQNDALRVRVRQLEMALKTIAEHEKGSWHGQVAERVLSPQAEPQLHALANDVPEGEIWFVGPKEGSVTGPELKGKIINVGPQAEPQEAKQ